MATLTAVSGGGAKGPACFLLEAEGRRLLFDLGYGPQPGLWPDVSRVGKVDALLLSHAHRDHAGGLEAAAGRGKPAAVRERAARASPEGPCDRRHFPAERHRASAGFQGHHRAATATRPGGVWIHVDVCGGVLYMGDYSRESLVYAYDPPPPARVVILDASYGDVRSLARRLRPEARRALPGPRRAAAGARREDARRRSRCISRAKASMPALDDAVRQAIGLAGRRARRERAARSAERARAHRSRGARHQRPRHHARRDGRRHHRRRRAPDRESTSTPPRRISFSPATCRRARPPSV